MTTREAYAVLEVPLDATPDHIRTAYLQAAKVWHPDRFTGDAVLQDRASEKLRLCIEAYGLVRDAPLRAATAEPGPASPPPTPTAPESPLWAPPPRPRALALGTRLAVGLVIGGVFATGAAIRIFQRWEREEAARRALHAAQVDAEISAEFRRQQLADAPAPAPVTVQAAHPVYLGRTLRTSRDGYQPMAAQFRQVEARLGESLGGSAVRWARNGDAGLLSEAVWTEPSLACLRDGIYGLEEGDSVVINCTGDRAYYVDLLSVR
jgi:hypothetical protein